MKNLGVILILVGYVAMALATVSGLGYGLYLMGVAGLTFGPAAWGGFVLFAKMLGGGLLSLVAGAVLSVGK
jgi:hypothetical protein